LLLQIEETFDAAKQEPVHKLGWVPLEVMPLLPLQFPRNDE
jgi:hypothetical protein